MSGVRIQSGETEPIQVYVLDALGNPLTGLTDLYVRLRRASDGQFLDWADDTFKAAGWTTLGQLLTEQDATNAPGVYEVTGGLNTSALTNAASEDVYTVVPYQTPGTTAVLPAPEELHVGAWADQVGLLANVSVTATDTVPATVEILAWLTRKGAPVTSGLVSASVALKQPDGTVLVAAGGMTGPNADGVFRRTVMGVTLANATNYYADLTITDALGAVRDLQAQPTVG